VAAKLNNNIFGFMEKKVVLITGASTGIGRAVAVQCMNNGYKVYAASRSKKTSERAQCGDGEIISIQMDVNIQSQVESTLTKILSENNRLDVLVSNAGNGIAGAVEDTTEEEFRYQMETNFFGTVRVIQVCIPIFRKQGYGKIIATSSVAGIIPIPFQAFYSASKAAINLFMQALRLELKPYGIQCCTILPGDTKTNFTASRKYTTLSQSQHSVYASTLKKSVGKMEIDEQNGMPADAVARFIVKQISSKRMDILVVTGLPYKIITLLYGILPIRLRLWIVGLLYG
jgi:short-subunit dehydrogenase